MRILFVPQQPFFAANGGFEVQQLQTIHALRDAGIRVEMLDLWKSSYDIDLIHLFGSEVGHVQLASHLKSRGVPYVTSAMFMPQQSRWKHWIFHGIKNFIPNTALSQRIRILENSSHIITLTNWESHAIRTLLNIKDVECTVVPNGVEERFFTASKELFVNTHHLDDFVLCVSRVEHRKNQLRLARAMANTGIPTVFVGPMAEMGVKGETLYLKEFEDVVNSSPTLHWLGGIDHADPMLASAFAAARVHVLPTYIDAQGMVTTEAAAAGCSIVVGDIPTQRELYGDSVRYVNPFDESHIAKVVKSVYAEPRGSIRPPASLMPSWAEVAQKLIVVYEKALKV